jgi:hypothetical protein
MKKNNMLPEKSNETISDIYWVEVLIEEDSSWGKRLLAISGRALYILSPPTSSPCSVCPPESFCPDGPTLEFKIELDKIKRFLDFTNVARVALYFIGHKPNNMITKIFTKKEESKVKIMISFVDFVGKNIVTELMSRIIPKVRKDKLVEYCLKNALNGAEIGSKGFYCIFARVFQGNKKLTQDDFYGPKKLVVLEGGNFIILEERPDYWFYCEKLVDSEEGEEVYLEYDPDMKPASGTIMKRTEAAKKKYLTEWRKYPLTSLKLIAFEFNETPSAELKFGKDDSYHILFGDDSSRERFKSFLIQTMNLTKDKVKMEIYSGH